MFAGMFRDSSISPAIKQLSKQLKEE